MTLFSNAIPNNVVGTIVASQQMEYNGSDNDLMRGNVDQILMDATSISASTAVTATNFGRSIIAWAEITSGLPPGSASTTFALKVQAVAPVGTNRFLTIGSTLVRSASGIVALAISPHFPFTTSLSSGAFAQITAIVPRNIRILASISTAAASFGMVLALGLSTIK